MDVLVTGATGFVGRRLVPALVEADHDVTVLTRDADRYDGPASVRVAEDDLLAPREPDEREDGPPGLAAALEVDAAYYLVHSMGATGDFAERDRRAARHFVDAASEAGLGRIVYLGGLGADEDDLSEHLRSRREIERVLADGSPELTTLRAGIVIGAGSAGFEMVRDLARRLPVMVTPRWVRTRTQPIAVADVIAYLVGVLDHPETAGETYEIGGPDVLTYAEMIRQVGRQLGHEPVIVPVPVLTPRLSALWVGFVTDVPTSVAGPLIDGLRNPVVVRDDRIRSVVPVELTPFEEAVAAALEAESDGE